MKVLKFILCVGISVLSSKSVYASEKYYEEQEVARLNGIVKCYVSDNLDRQRRYDLEVIKDQDEQKAKAQAPKKAEVPNPPEAEKPKPSKAEVPKPPKGWHLPAIGQVFVPKGCEYKSGTATHIGDGCLVSAAHVFSDIIEENFPDRPIAKKNGRVKIDLSKRGAVFVFEGKGRAHINLTAIVFDVRYINTVDFHKSAWFKESTENYDYAFLLLDTKQMPADMPAIPLIESDNVFSLKNLKAPKMCAYYGYGAAADKSIKGRHHVVQQLVLNRTLKPWEAFYLGANDVVKHGNTMHAAEDLETILNKKLDKRFDKESAGAQPGDSGGGLILKTKKGLRLIAVCATFCTNYYFNQPFYTNGFASFIHGNQDKGFSGNPELLEIVKKLKKNSSK